MSITVTGRGPDPLGTLQPNPNTDYRGLCEAHWLLARRHKQHVNDLRAEYAALNRRLVNGNVWLHANPEPTLTRRNAERLKAGIEADLRAVGRDLHCEYRTTWNAIRNAWVAARMMVKSEATSAHAPVTHQNQRSATNEPQMMDSSSGDSGALTGDPSALAAYPSPVGIWSALMGNADPPGSWPPQPGEEYVPERWQVAAWEIDELREVVEQ